MRRRRAWPHPRTPHHPNLPRLNLYLHPNPCPNPSPAQAESLTAALAELYIKTPDQLRTALDSEDVLGQVGANPDPNLNPPLTLPNPNGQVGANPDPNLNPPEL